MIFNTFFLHFSRHLWLLRLLREPFLREDKNLAFCTSRVCTFPARTYGTCIFGRSYSDLPCHNSWNTRATSVTTQALTVTVRVPR